MLIIFNIFNHNNDTKIYILSYLYTLNNKNDYYNYAIYIYTIKRNRYVLHYYY